MTTHLGGFVLERYSVEDLPADETAEARRHLDECAVCRRRLASLEEQAARDLADLPPAVFMAQVRERRARKARWSTAWAGAVLALGAAAGTWLWLTPAPEADVVLLRGQGVEVQRQRDGVVSRFGPADSIRAGDALRVVVTLPKPASVDVWFLDDEGSVDRPLTNEPVHLAIGEHALPNSAVVSEPCVDLWVVVGIGTAATPDTEAALRRLGPGKRDPDLSWLPSGCFAMPLECEGGLP